MQLNLELIQLLAECRGFLVQFLLVLVDGEWGDTDFLILRVLTVSWNKVPTSSSSCAFFLFRVVFYSELLHRDTSHHLWFIQLFITCPGEHHQTLPLSFLFSVSVFPSLVSLYSNRFNILNTPWSRYIHPTPSTCLLLRFLGTKS